MAVRTNVGVTSLQQLFPKQTELIKKTEPTVTQSNTAAPRNSGGLFRLQAVLNNRVYEQRNNNPPQVQESTTQINQDSANPENNYTSYQTSDNNRSNLYIAQDELGYNTPMSAEEQLKLVSEYENKKMEKDAAMAGVASLQNAFGKTGGFSTVFGSYTPR